jgi:hypothetical protein
VWAARKNAYRCSKKDKWQVISTLIPAMPIDPIFTQHFLMLSDIARFGTWWHRFCCITGKVHTVPTRYSAELVRTSLHAGSPGGIEKAV